MHFTLRKTDDAFHVSLNVWEPQWGDVWKEALKGGQAWHTITVEKLEEHFLRACGPPPVHRPWFCSQSNSWSWVTHRARLVIKPGWSLGDREMAGLVTWRVDSHFQTRCWDSEMPDGSSEAALLWRDSCYCLSTQLCSTLMTTWAVLLGSPIHGVLQARILPWVAISSTRGSSWLRDWTHMSCVGRWVLYYWASREASGGTDPQQKVQSSCSPLDILSPRFILENVHFKAFLFGVNFETAFLSWSPSHVKWSQIPCVWTAKPSIKVHLFQKVCLPFFILFLHPWSYEMDRHLSIGFFLDTLLPGQLTCIRSSYI